LNDICLFHFVYPLGFAFSYDPTRRESHAGGGQTAPKADKPMFIRQLILAEYPTAFGLTPTASALPKVFCSFFTASPLDALDLGHPRPLNN
jgi:hypothetical protein